jgi:hypothetical protein
LVAVCGCLRKMATSVKTAQGWGLPTHGNPP